MPGCGHVEILEGGSIKDTDIDRSRITGSTITSSVFDAGVISNLTALDTNSAQTVADTLAALGPGQLKDLAEALVEALASSTATPAPASEGGELPTDIVGGRDMLLGKPDSYAVYGAGYVVPLYQKSGA